MTFTIKKSINSKQDERCSNIYDEVKMVKNKHGRYFYYPAQEFMNKACTEKKYISPNHKINQIKMAEVEIEEKKIVFDSETNEWKLI